MSRRYEAVGEAHEVWRVTTNGALITIMVSDVRDKRTGTVYRDGHHRVVVTKSKQYLAKGQPNSRSFFGELAWCQAERHAEDLVAWYRREADKLRHQV
jgi:hypothetical protein